MTRNNFNKLVQQCVYLLRENYNVKRIYLIGSLVNGKIHAGTVIDIVVEGLKPHLYLSALTKLYDVLPPGIDLNLIPFEDAYLSLKEKTLKEGKLMYAA